MDSKRAREIFEGNENIEVLYNGTPVWIQGIRGRDGQDAEVSYVSNQNGKPFWVPVIELDENHGESH